MLTQQTIVNSLKRISILAHPLRPQTYPVAEQIAASLRRRNCDVSVFTNWTHDDAAKAVSDCGMVVAIGGDGAMLRAARVSAPMQVPVLGVNMGQLGFLTEIRDPDDWDAQFERILQGDFWIENRMMLNVRIMRRGEVIAVEDALNDVVVSGSVVGRMIQLETFIDSDWTTTYHADALVIASATGSTAYALACGGPILPPELNNILIVPAAPHLSMDRPIVLSEGANVEVRPSSMNRSDIVVNADGIRVRQLENGDLVRIQASEHQARFVRLRSRNYFYRSLLDRLEPRVQRDGPEHTDSDGDSY
jgi:NAD+ kinase